MAERKPKKTTTDPVVKLSRAELVVIFDYEEWTCVRHLWKATGQPLGAIWPLFDAQRGTLGEDGLQIVRAMLARAEDYVLSAPVQAHTNSDELIELAKRVWKVPYRKVTNSGDRVYKGTKAVGDYGDPATPAVPSYGDLPVYRTAFDKLASVSGTGDAPLEVEVIGLRFMVERIKAALA